MMCFCTITLMLLKTISIIIILLMISIILTIPAVAYPTSVSINAPESVGSDFSAVIGIENAVDFDSGQLDLSFNSSAVNVTGVASGNASGTMVPASKWRFMDANTIKVLFCIFSMDTVTGSAIDASVLNISNGKLFNLDTYSERIPAIRNDCEVTV